MNNWLDFSNVDDGIFELIPEDTIVKVKIEIESGGYSNEEMGILGNLATYNHVLDHDGERSSIYLKCKLRIIEGKYKGRIVFHNIGLHSSKGPEFGNMGKIFIKRLLMSSKYVTKKDVIQNPDILKISGFEDINNREFYIKVGINTFNNRDHNTVKNIVTKDDKDFQNRDKTKDEILMEFIDDEIPF